MATAEQFIQQQRGVLERELSQGESLEPRVVPIPGECEPPTEAHSNIELTWNATPREGELTALLLASLQLIPGSVDLDLRVRDQPISFVPGAVLGAAGVNVDGLVLLATTGVDAMTLQPVTIALFMPLANYRPGTVEFHGYETYGLVSTASPRRQPAPKFSGSWARVRSASMRPDPTRAMRLQVNGTRGSQPTFARRWIDYRDSALTAFLTRLHSEAPIHCSIPRSSTSRTRLSTSFTVGL